jgi:hypothetical protein
MSTNPNNPTPYQAPGSNPPPRSKGRGVWMGLGIGCAVLLVICCGGFVGVYYWMKNAATDDPVQIAKIAEEIAEVPLPAEFRPKMGFNLSFFGQAVKGVIYAPEKDDSFFLMGEYDAKMTDAERDQIVEQMRGSWRTQGNSNNQDLEVISSKTVELTMRGKPATFKFDEAKNRKTNAKFWQLSGTFVGKKGPAMMILILPYERFQENELKRMLEDTK